MLVCNYFHLHVIDINECARGTHNCQQRCNNTVGSYDCSCNSGYSLSSNGRTCNGQSSQVIHNIANLVCITTCRY